MEGISFPRDLSLGELSTPDLKPKYGAMFQQMIQIGRTLQLKVTHEANEHLAGKSGFWGHGKSEEKRFCFQQYNTPMDN